MKSLPLWLLFIGTIVGVLAIRPTGELLIRSEVQRHTGSRLSMDRCQFNIFTGGLVVEGALVERDCELASDDTLSQTQPIKIDKIWSKGSLQQLLYRKLSAPITVMDGVVIGLSKLDENRVPAVEPITQSISDKVWSLSPPKNPFIDELDQIFLTTQQALQQNGSSFDRVDQQLTILEKQTLRVDNPLRDREALLTAKQSASSLQLELVEVRNTLERNRQSFQQASAAVPRSMPADNLSPDPRDKFGNPEDIKAIEMQAQSLTEQLVCSTVAQMKPYLGLSAALTRQWLINTHKSDARMINRSGPKQTIAARGMNYGFGAMNDNEIHFGSIRMRGAAIIEEKRLPFSGQMKNIGSMELGAEQRPSLNLTFATQKQAEFDELPWVAVSSTIIPDRQGFRIQSQMVPAGAMIASTAQGDWKVAAFGQDSIVNLVWLVHQSEWSLDIDILSSQCEVVVKRETSLSPPASPELKPRYETCFISSDYVSLAKAKFQGNVQEEIPHQRSFEIESPLAKRLAESMLQQQKSMLDIISSTTNPQQAETAFSQSLASYHDKVEEMHGRLAEVHEQLQARLQGYQSTMAATLPTRDELRFSRDGVERVQR